MLPGVSDPRSIYDHHRVQGSGVCRSFRRKPVIHDVLLALSFLAIVTAPAFIVMRTDRGHHDL